MANPISSSSFLNSSMTRWPYPRIVLHAFTLAILSLGSLMLIHLIAWSSESIDWIVRENGALENVQASILAAAFVGGLIAMTRTGVSRWRTIAVAISCIALAGWAREIQSTSSKPLGVTEPIGFTLDRSFRHSLMACATVAVACRAVVAWVRHPEDRSLWFDRRFIWPIVPFVGCFVVSQVCEELHLIVAEETVEIMAYSMLLLCSIWIIRKQSEAGISVDVEDSQRIQAI